MLNKINDYIYANIVPNAQGYRFRVTNEFSDEPQFIDRALRVFQLTQLPNYQFDTTYFVQVDVKLNGVWQNNFGSICEINTPEPLTAIEEVFCNQVYASKLSYINAGLVPYATGYRFRVVNLSTNEESVIDRPLRSLQVNKIPNLTDGTTYQIEVAVRNTDGSYMSFGSACTIVYSTQSTAQNSKINSAQVPFSIVSFPNPFDTKTTVQLSSQSNQNCILKVYDMTGKIIESKEIHSLTFEIQLGENYTSGVYLITVSDGYSTTSCRIIKR